MSGESSKSVIPRSRIYMGWSYDDYPYDVVERSTGWVCNVCNDYNTGFEIICETSLRVVDVIPYGNEIPFCICDTCADQHTIINPAFIAYTEASNHLPDSVANIVSEYYDTE